MRLFKKKSDLKKLKSRLEEIKKACKKKEWESKEEEKFLILFSDSHVEEAYCKNEYGDGGYNLRTEYANILCSIALKNKVVWVSYDFIWGIFYKYFGEISISQLESFTKKMMKKYFKMEVIKIRQNEIKWENDFILEF